VAAVLEEIEGEAAPKPEGVVDDPDPRPAHAYAPWIRPIDGYVRRETTVSEGNRYG
jgi:hypothetical protein